MRRRAGDSGLIRRNLAKVGAFAAIMAAAACPTALPRLAALGENLGLGVLAPFEAIFFWAAQTFVIVALAGLAVSHEPLPRRSMLSLAFASAALFFAGLYMPEAETFAYLGLAGIATAIVLAQRAPDQDCPLRTED